MIEQLDVLGHRDHFALWAQRQINDRQVLAVLFMNGLQVKLRTAFSNSHPDRTW